MHKLGDASDEGGPAAYKEKRQDHLWGNTAV